ncbi:hypothetical protein LIER_03330 [Lithospermum erythrorhizon]|uniref:Uncharacterized protein n=1 Tax=Lithospermum erythrorhizon TaxID=34254 RepID=A0AAV3NSW6_LITER
MARLTTVPVAIQLAILKTFAAYNHEALKEAQKDKANIIRKQHNRSPQLSCTNAQLLEYLLIPRIPIMMGKDRPFSTPSQRRSLSSTSTSSLRTNINSGRLTPVVDPVSNKNPAVGRR